MKKTSLLFAFSLFALASNAQTPAVFSGSTYVQNFSTLNSGLPAGWYCDTGATATTLGTGASLSTAAPYFLPADSSCHNAVSTRGFKNYPSANAIGTVPTLNACPDAAGVVDRALGIRQIGTSGFDPGAAFSFLASGTQGITNLNLTFKLQSLDTSSPRVTTWSVDYGFGLNPSSFTPATATGTLTTGGHTFSNNTVTVNFGTALDNKTTPIWIRIRPSAASTGSGNRASTAIDDFTLTWTGTAQDHTGVTDINGQSALSLSVLGAATSSEVSFVYYAEQAGDYNLAIYDLSGRMIHTATVASKGGQQTLNVTGLNLVPGMYVAKMFNGNSSSTAKVMVY